MIKMQKFLENNIHLSEAEKDRIQSIQDMQSFMVKLKSLPQQKPTLSIHVNLAAFFNEGKGTMAVVHGDDFTSSGPKASLDWLRDELKAKYELVEQARLGPGGPPRCGGCRCGCRGLGSARPGG